MFERLERNEDFVIAAHRGWKSAYPENTLLAFKQALELGVDMLEFDLHFSKDKEVVVIHDATLDRTTNGSGKVSEHTLEELKRLDAGGWLNKEFEGVKIPTLAELCELVAAYPGVLLNVEVKRSPDAKDVMDAAVKILQAGGVLERCLFTCFDAAVLAHMHDVHGVRTQGFPGEQMSNFVQGEDGTLSKMWAVGLEMGMLTRELVREYERLGVLPWCYCPDTEQAVLYALGCGVRTMTVNNPLPARKIRRQLDMERP